MCAIATIAALTAKETAHRSLEDIEVLHTPNDEAAELERLEQKTSA